MNPCKMASVPGNSNESANGNSEKNSQQLPSSGPSVPETIASAEMSVFHGKYAASRNFAAPQTKGATVAHISATRFGSEPVRNPDGTPLLDHNQRPISIDKILATKPLRAELSSRPGPGGRKLTYMSGDGVTRTLNDIFGFDGWCLDIKDTKREECMKDDKGRFHVAYTATVRVTHRQSGTYKEDCGAGDSIDKSLGTAISHSLKGAVTDGMKRAARHFGDKLGNSLYQGGFNMSKAPATLKGALDAYDIERAKSKFGFDKDRKPSSEQTKIQNNATSNDTSLEEMTESIGIVVNGTGPKTGIAPIHRLGSISGVTDISTNQGLLTRTQGPPAYQTKQPNTYIGNITQSTPQQRNARQQYVPTEFPPKNPPQKNSANEISNDFPKAITQTPKPPPRQHNTVNATAAKRSAAVCADRISTKKSTPEE